MDLEGMEGLVLLFLCVGIWMIVWGTLGIGD